MPNKWDLPEHGTPYYELKPRLDKAVEENIDYLKKVVLGFPGTPPLPEAVVAFQLFTERHPNNIGVHTINPAAQAEYGFGGTQQLERELIYTVATMAGAEDPESEIDGSICMGGSEGNDHGMWLGRNMLSKQPTTTDQGIAVLTSKLAHYSVIKHFSRLFPNLPPDPTDPKRANKLELLETNADGELDAPIIKAAIEKLYAERYRRFLLVLTAGTTNLGSVDQIQEISDYLRRLTDVLGIQAQIHVDAAFGGFVLPFTAPDYPFGFQNKFVQSVLIDVHKMGYAPYSSGIFLCRKGLLEHTKTPAEYIAAHSDHTVCGSRSGSIAAACWTTLKVLGRAGYREKVQHCIAMRNYLRDRIAELNEDGEIQAWAYKPRLDINIQAILFSEKITHILKEESEKGGMSIAARLCIPRDEFPKNLTDGIGGGMLSNSKSEVFRFTLMPHVTREKIDEFIEELKAALALAPA